MKKISKIVVLIYLMFFGIVSVSAAPTIYERDTNTLSINKPEINIVTSRESILSTPLVDASQKVYDFSNVLSEAEEQELQSKVKNFIQMTNMDMVIVTCDELWNDYAIEAFADDFFDYNDFGMDTSGTSYDGILAIRNTNDYNRYYYVSTSGLGQVYFPYERIESILDDMYYGMHNDDFYQGFADFIASAYRQYALGVPSKYQGATVDKYGELYDAYGNHISYETGVYRVPVLQISFISALITLIIMLILSSKNKMVKKATEAKEYLDKDSINYTAHQDNFLHTHTSSVRITSSDYSGGGGGGGSHHSSSGMSHGGGGRHC